MLRRIITLLITMLLALSVAVPAASAQSPTYVRRCESNTFEVSHTDDIVLRCIWGAKTEGQVHVYLQVDVISMELRDQTGNVVFTLDAEDAAKYWTDPFKVKASDYGFECKPDVQWVSLWVYPLGTLATGRYTLTVNEAYLHPVNDGVHTCSIDGERIPSPSLYPAGPLPTVTVTIIVS